MENSECDMKFFQVSRMKDFEQQISGMRVKLKWVYVKITITRSLEQIKVGRNSSLQIFTVKKKKKKKKEMMTRLE